jgi:hypothetical protein
MIQNNHIIHVCNYHDDNPDQGKYKSSILSAYLQKCSVIIVHIAVP